MNNSSDKMTPQKWPQWVMAVIAVALIIIVAVVMTKSTNPTPLENGLLTFILTAASCFISYLATKVYAEAGFNQVLRDHGVQIARNIMELKSQIGSLSDWVGTKRAVFLEEDQDHNHNVEATLEHIQLTLRGFQGLADNAVGGIAGVIGDAYNQYEDFIDKITRIRSEADVKTFELKERLLGAGVADVKDLEDQLNKITDETKRKVSALAERSSMPIPLASLPQAVTAKCPSCYAPNTFEMIPRAGETRIVVCRACGNRFNAHLSSTQDIVTRPLRFQATPPAKSGAWQHPENVESEAKAILLQTQALVEPGLLTSIIPLVLRADQALAARGGAKTPYELQADILKTPDKGCSSRDLRNFLKLVFWGRGFEIPEPQPKTFKSNYTNVLTEDHVLVAYTRGAIGRLRSLRPLAKAQSMAISKALFSSDFQQREPLVSSIISEKPSP